MNQISKYLVGIALSLVVSAANAALVQLRPDSSVVAPGGTVSFQLFADFGTQTTIGGAVDIGFNPDLIRFASFAFDPAFGVATSYGGTDAIPPNRDSLFDVIDTSRHGLVSIGFGNFAGISGAFTAGKLVFTVVADAPRNTNIGVTMAASPPDHWGAFIGLTGVTYTGATITVAPSVPVPEPASAWLFASGLGVLGMVMLRCRSDLV